jgi:hypothetical protein
LEITRALNFASPRLIDEAEALSDEVRKMLFGILGSLKDTKKLPATPETEN